MHRFRFLVGLAMALLEDVITEHIGSLFPGRAIAATAKFRITRDADVEPPEVDALLKRDPVLAGRILDAVNAPPFQRDQPCATIGRAVALIGLNTIRTLAAGFSLMEVTKCHEAQLDLELVNVDDPAERHRGRCDVTLLDRLVSDDAVDGRLGDVQMPIMNGYQQPLQEPIPSEVNEFLVVFQSICKLGIDILCI